MLTTVGCLCPSDRLEGSNVEVFSLHPGVIQTPLGRHVGTAQGTWTGWLFGWLGAFWIKSTEQARAPRLHLQRVGALGLCAEGLKPTE